MRLGVVFPQIESGTDLGAIQEYMHAVESLGYDHLVAFDHVVGANPASRPGWRGPYTHADTFHEPLVFFAYLAGIAKGLELVTGILISPQRQTVLVAKQAAEIDLLTGGRFRLGMGIGWNDVEYEALGENFHNRGRRIEEQVELLRALWTKEVVTYKGRWHTITDAGINPLPVQRPIPIWLGGRDDRVLKRIAKVGDGWFANIRPDNDARTILTKLQLYLRQEGRNRTDLGVESWVAIAGRTPNEWGKEVLGWKELGATHLSVNTMRAGLSFPKGHVDAIKRFKEIATDVLPK